MSPGDLDLLPFEDYMRSLPRKRMSAGALFYDDQGRVLLIEPSYKPDWDIPGGTVDAEEPPWTTAKREVHEELGLTRPLGRLLVIDYVSTDEHMPEGLAFVLDGGIVTEYEIQELDITDPEIVSVGLYELDEARAKVGPPLAKRLSAALTAFRDGKIALCENGNRTV